MGGIVHDPGGRLLLVLRGNDPGRGKWSIPGGRVESGESDDTAVRRELAEETGLSVTVERLCGVVERPAPGGIFVINDYLCGTTDTAAKAASDAAAVRWVDGSEFAALDRAGELVDLLYETLRDWDVLPRTG